MNLFDPKPKNVLHKNFKYLVERKRTRSGERCYSIMGRRTLDKNNEKEKFLNEFQTTFNSSFWELYLNKAFKELGFNIDYSKESPDFCLSTADGYTLNIEAVVADTPTNILASYDPSLKLLSDDKFIDECTIKLLGRLKSKLDLFKGVNGKKHPYNSLEHVKGNPFVVAVAPFNNGIFFFSKQYIY
ncbi:Uncharacterised protein [Proteus mirabilis]|uniref:Uncharacterized protein n=1 Tax=Proteus mirabilis TaxID=584 RepID=A0A379FFW4_PROMI|nr:Uncharacterised protein [Proteus mirabilis]